MKVRIKARNAMNLIERGLCAYGKRFKFPFWQETVTQLNCPQVVEDHGAPSRVKTPGEEQVRARRGEC